MAIHDTFRCKKCYGSAAILGRKFHDGGWVCASCWGPIHAAILQDIKNYMARQSSTNTDFAASTLELSAVRQAEVDQ